MENSMDIFENTSPNNVETNNPQYSSYVVHSNRIFPSLEKVGLMWNLKYEISSQKFFGIFIKINLEGVTDIDIKNFYNHIKVWLNTITRLQSDIFPAYQKIKQHYYFYEHCVSDRSYPSYYCNICAYNYLSYSIFVSLTNENFIKYPMAPQAYKIFITHANEIVRWTIISIIIYDRDPHLGGMNGDVQSNFSTLSFKQE